MSGRPTSLSSPTREEAAVANVPSAENDVPLAGTPRGPLRWACAVCMVPLLGREHRVAPEDGHAPVRILTRDLPPADGGADE